MLDESTGIASLERWLRRHLLPVADQLTARMVGRSLGNEAEHAFEFDGYGLLEDFLIRLDATGSSYREFITDGIAELVGNVQSSAERRYDLTDRKAVLDSCRSEKNATLTTSATLEEAVQAAHHFYLLSRAALEKARFGDQQRAADIAFFETYRLAAIGALESGRVDGSEIRLLAQILSWHQAFDASTSDELAVRLLDSMGELRTETARFAHHSLVLRLVRSTPTIHQRLSDSALQLISTTVRLDGLTGSEEKIVASVTPGTLNSQLEVDLALISKSLIIIPRGKRGPLRHDAEFDKLWALYRRLVPWSTRDGPAD